MNTVECFKKDMNCTLLSVCCLLCYKTDFSCGLVRSKCQSVLYVEYISYHHLKNNCSQNFVPTNIYTHLHVCIYMCVCVCVCVFVCVCIHIYMATHLKLKLRIPPMHQTTLFILSIFLEHFSRKSIPTYFIYTLFHSFLLLQ